MKLRNFANYEPDKHTDKFQTYKKASIGKNARIG